MSDGTRTLKSTGESAKKRRSGVVVDEEETESEDEEEDDLMGARGSWFQIMVSVVSMILSPDEERDHTPLSHADIILENDIQHEYITSDPFRN